VNKICLWSLTISGLIVGASTIASASPATNVLGPNTAVQTAHVEQVDYYYNHHRYQHRSWDKKRRRWRYY
jgi:hypothetical protein